MEDISNKSESHSPKKMRLSQLPIYSYHERVYEYQQPNHPAAITGLRKFCFGLVNNTKNFYNSANHIYSTGVSHTRSSLEFLQSEPAILQRAAVITLGSLMGVVVSFRKRPVMRALYGGAFGGVAASVCYPKETIGAVQTSFDAAKDQALNYWEQYRPGSPYSPQTTAQKSTSTYYENKEVGSEAANDSKPVDPTPVEDNKPAQNVPEEDRGMGKEDEKFMYTTRK